MNNYFTISEFAKLRNININFLRYHEKLGILKPAYIHKKTITDIIHQNNYLSWTPAGQLLEIHPSKKMRYRLFPEIIDHTKEHPNIITVPQGSYSCSQIELIATTDLSEIINTNWGTQEEITLKSVSSFRFDDFNVITSKLLSYSDIELFSCPCLSPIFRRSPASK